MNIKRRNIRIRLNGKLIERPDAKDIVSKEQISGALYTLEDEITPNAVEKCISRLRIKIEPSGIAIRTVRGLGYFLETPNESTN
ncbi:MAG: winged helix-turn-helix domain-containing protein [Betaproteobacteria bacterium]